MYNYRCRYRYRYRCTWCLLLVSTLRAHSECLLWVSTFCCLGRSLEAQRLYFICVCFRAMRNEVHTRCEGYWHQRSRVLTRGHILRALKHLQHILLCMCGSAIIEPSKFSHNVRNIAGCLLNLVFEHVQKPCEKPLWRPVVD